MIPLFDALAHPTVSGSWLGKEEDNTFEKLVESLKNAGFSGACAVGLAGVDGYSHESFLERCQQFPELVPIAGVNPKYPAAIDELARLRRMGFKGIKIHPRYSDVDLALEQELLVSLICTAAEHNLVVFICTYNHTQLDRYPRKDPLYSLVSVLKAVGDAPVVLVHGGDVRVMEYAEMVRFNPNLLLDLSLTLMKYRGSSLDLDLKFLFRQFDRRICIGSDHPEYWHDEIRSRFEQLAEGLTEDKKTNIASRNIMQFLNLH